MCRAQPNLGFEEGLISLALQGIKQVNHVVWILDSGCSRHMTGDRALLSNVVEKAGPVITFGDNNKGLTQGYGSLLVKNVISENSLLFQLYTSSCHTNTTCSPSPSTSSGSIHPGRSIYSPSGITSYL